MKVQIERTDTIFDVCEFDFKDQCVTWYDGGISRSIPVGKSCEVETLDKTLAREGGRVVKIMEGDVSKDYKCGLYDECCETLLCLKRDDEECQ